MGARKMKPLREQKDYEIVQAYRNVFSGMNGNLVLEDILDTAGWFDVDQENQTTERAALRTFANWILHRCGINADINQPDIVKALFSQVPVQTFEDTDKETDENE